MRRLPFLLLPFFFFGCSYNLKTSLLEESAFLVDEVRSQKVSSFEDCGESRYCFWEAMYNVSTFKQYEAFQLYKADHRKVHSLWDVSLQSKINYAAVTEDECKELVGQDLFKQCMYAVKFNQISDFNCSQETTDQELCLQQEIFSRFPAEGCESVSGTQAKDDCLIAAALTQNNYGYCDGLWDESLKDECRSMIGNSLYFCEDRSCVDFYFDRNMTRTPRLVYCDFDDVDLQQHCDRQIRNWFALSQQNFLYCPTKECYQLLIDKYRYYYPTHQVGLVQGKACGHLTRIASKERCDDFVSDTLAALSRDIELCSSRDCFNAFRGDLAFADEAVCSVFEKDNTQQDLFAIENVQREYCYGIVRHNQALLNQDISFCLDNLCVVAIEEQKLANIPQEDPEIFISVEEALQALTFETCSDFSAPVCGFLNQDGFESYMDFETPCLAFEENAQVVGFGTCGEILPNLLQKINEMPEVSLEESAEAVLEEEMLLPELNLDEGNFSLDSIDVNEFAQSVDLNEAVKEMDLNVLRDEIDPLGLLKGLDLNKFVQDLDLNEIAGKVDLNQAIKVVDIDKISKLSLQATQKNTVENKTTPLDSSSQ